MERIKVTLDENEFAALTALAQHELRPVPDEARAVIRERLQHEGLLQAMKPAPCESAEHPASEAR